MALSFASPSPRNSTVTDTARAQRKYRTAKRPGLLLPSDRDACQTSVSSGDFWRAQNPSSPPPLHDPNTLRMLAKGIFLGSGGISVKC